MPPHKKPLSSIRLPAIHHNLPKTNKLMGCASSQAAEIRAQQQFSENEIVNPPPTDAESTENSLSNAGENVVEEKSETSEVTKYPPAEAFEIPLDNLITPLTGDGSDSHGDSLIKRHPPKRLQRIVEQSEQHVTDATTTLENLEEKLAKAEVRRQKYLQKRVDTVLSLAQPTTLLVLTISTNNSEEDINSIEPIPELLLVNNPNNELRSESNNNYSRSKLTVPDNDKMINDDEEYYHSHSQDNNNHQMNNNSSLRNYSSSAATNTKHTVNNTVNEDGKYRSPGDGDERNEISQH